MVSLNCKQKFDAMWHGSVGCYCNLKSAGDFNCVGQGWEMKVSGVYIFFPFFVLLCHPIATIKLKNLMIAFTCADSLLSEVTVSVWKVVWKSLDTWQPSAVKAFATWWQFPDANLEKCKSLRLCQPLRMVITTINATPDLEQSI
jgi:hypothetical protein